MSIQTQIETIVRNTAKIVVDQPGWMADIDRTCTDVMAKFQSEADEHTFARDLLMGAAGRVIETLRGYYDALEANDGEAVLCKYFDLMPDDTQRKVRVASKAALRDCGVTADEFRDEAGRVFYLLGNAEALGVSDDASLVTLPAQAEIPAPVGRLHRVQ